MRYLGMLLDDVKDSPDIIEQVYEFLYQNKRSLKLVLYNRDVSDLDVAQFTKRYQEKLEVLGSQITRDFSVPVYFYIGDNQIPGYTMWYKGEIEKGLQHFKELLDTQDERRKHVR